MYKVSLLPQNSKIGRNLRGAKLKNSTSKSVIVVTYFFADMLPIASKNRKDRNIISRRFAMLTARLWGSIK